MATERQQRLINSIRRRPNHEWTLEELANIYYEGKRRPYYWRASLLVIMRKLADRSLREPVTLVRVSGVGRGQQARYSMQLQ